MTSKLVGAPGLSRRVTTAAAALLAPLAFLGLSSSALAEEHHPTGDYAQFADCPLANSATSLCIYALTESGEFVVGKKTVPITSTITLQGGVHVAKKLGKITGYEFIGAEDGNTLSKTPQNVPGGLAGLLSCPEISNFLERLACEVVFENGLTGVTATTELAAPASSIEINLQNLIEATGTALSLPIKVKLNNPLLGGSCYIGSNSNRIELPLTTGKTSPPEPNMSIEGKVGTVEVPEADEFNLSIVTENTLVNNSFAAPGPQGCGGIFAFLIDPLIEAKLGIPAAAGHNTAILNNSLKDANAPAVKESE